MCGHFALRNSIFHVTLHVLSCFCLFGHRPFTNHQYLTGFCILVGWPVVFVFGEGFTRCIAVLRASSIRTLL